MNHILDGKNIKIGTCYYPEHWPREMWESDIDRMLKAGIEAVRIAEFAWSKVELHEGEFDFSFFDEFLDLCQRTGMKVIFCTPTATPPAWLTEKYPEVLNADINGNLYRHGSRRHYNFNSSVYREKSRIITEKVASHYGPRECVIGWQLDNEFNCEINVYYSESDNIAFRKWVKNKYQTLDKLNDAWGTAFWNQTYTDFGEVYLPRPTVNTAQNPHQMLDYYRFISDSVRSFAKEQSDIIRKYAKPGDFITTNGMFGHLDNHALTKESLDVYMFDCYPNFNNRVDQPVDLNAFRDRSYSRMLTETRSISKIYGIMEQQTGADGWNIWPGVPSPRPGQIALWTMQSIAHGADYVSFFRWRTATFGTEMYWHGILDYSSRDNERLSEVSRIGAEVKKLSEVAGKEYVAKVGVLRDYDNNFDAEVDKWHGSVEWPSNEALFTAMQKSHTPFDYIYFYDGGLSADLSKYDVLFYAHPVIGSKERAEVLRKFVEAGGTLILGCRAGQKDLNGRCTMETLPGVFKELTGADVKEYSFIQPDMQKITVKTQAKILKAEVFTDRLSSYINGEALGTFEGDYYEGDVALMERSIGAGKVYYYGTAFNEESVEFFLEKCGVKDMFKDTVSAPESIELAMRGNCIFILNYKNEKSTVTFKRECKNLLTGESLEGEVTLPAYGYLICAEGLSPVR